MGTSAGPSLAGIGRGGDSNLVLEMDAHDAKSYPGEPTSNIFSNPNNWTGSDWNVSSGTVANNAAEGPNGGSAGSITATSADPYIYSNVVHSVATGGLTFSCWVKAVGSSVGKSGDIRINFSGTATGSATTVNYTLTGLWQRVSISGTVTGAGTIKVGIEPPNSAAVGDVVYLADAQLEQKSYATPFVREGNDGTGTYNARPASVNLMIRGNVGTGQTFSDSSPSKHTITANGNVTHSDAQSKFSGGSFLFDGTGDYLEPQSTTLLDITSNTQSFTVDMWVYPTSIATSGPDAFRFTSLFSKGLVYLSFGFESDGTIKFYTYDGSVHICETSAGIMQTDQWQHIAYVSNGGTLALYYNGASKTLSSTTLVKPSQTGGQGVGVKPKIGHADTGYAADGFIGYMDEYRITDGTALWTAAFTPPTRRNLSAPLVDRSGNNGVNFATKATTDFANYRQGSVLSPIFFDATRNPSVFWDLDGTDDYMRCESPTFASDLTGAISIWARADALGDSLVSFSKPSTGVVDEMRLGYYTNNKIQFVIYQNGAGDKGFTTDADAISLNQWHHITCVNDGSATYIYVDGVMVKSDTDHYWWGDLTTDADTFTIGALERSSTLYLFNGRIGNLAIYSAPLTAQQVKENFNQQRNRFGV